MMTLQEQIETIFNKTKVDVSNMSESEIEHKYQEVFFPHRFQRNVDGIQECLNCKNMLVIFGTKQCSICKSNECTANDFKYKK